MLKTIYLKVINFTTSLFSKSKQIENKQDDHLIYHSLAPTDKPDGVDSYLNALNWAIKNRRTQDIKNIAITGPYGSGKSSVLKSFQLLNHDKSIKIINISLATFTLPNKKDTEGTEISQKLLIEQSILQQIFFHELNTNLPDSRLKKIKSISKKTLVLNTILVILSMTMFCIFIGGKSFFQFVFKWNINEWWSVFFHWLSLVFIIFVVYKLVYQSIRSILGFTLKKMNIQDLEIEFKTDRGSSILNEHLDEIIYFFETTHTNIVFIEDLDRLDCPEIFVKLREINWLINNSKKIQDRVVFIYAVKDDIFIDKDRAKFFDFIIPIIPIVNHSNSEDLLLIERSRFKLDLSDELIGNLSLFISDMRVLRNIINEYVIVNKQMNPNLNQDKLFSMIVYKNLYPQDFNKLYMNDGILNLILKSRDQQIESMSEFNSDGINELKLKIENINDSTIESLKELNMKYVIKYLEKFQDKNFKSFLFDGNEITMMEICEEENFEKLRKNELKKFNSFNKDFGNRFNLIPESNNIKFEDIELEVDNLNSYEEKRIIVHNKHTGRVKEISKQIEKLISQNNLLNSEKLSALWDIKFLDTICEVDHQKMLLNVLLKNGYIDENYHDYISVFHEESISNSDYEFLLRIKSEFFTESSTRLDKIEKLVEKIELRHFSKEYILNYDLVNYLLNIRGVSDKRMSIVNQFANKPNLFVNFIDVFIDTKRDVSILVHEIAKVCKLFWSFVEMDYMDGAQEKSFYFELLIKFASVESIIEMAEHSDLKKYFENTFIFQDSFELKKTIDLVKKMNLKFSKLEFETTNSEFLEFIYEGNYYDLNSEVIRGIVKKFGHYNEDEFEKQNYYAIKNSKCANLIKYINVNLGLYLSETYLTLDNNTEEKEDELCELVNDENIEIGIKEQIIMKVETSIENFSESLDYEVDNLFLRHSKVKPTWEMVFNHYKNNESTISTDMLTFLSNESNTKLLALGKIKLDEENSESREYTNFKLSLLKLNELSDVCYQNLLSAMPYVWDSMNIDEFSSEHVKLLLDRKSLKCTVSNYNKIEEFFPQLIIDFIENHKDEFFDIIDEIDLTVSVIADTLNSSILGFPFKKIIFENRLLDPLSGNKNLIKSILDFVLNNFAMLKLNDKLALQIISFSEIEVTNRLKLFNLFNVPSCQFNSSEIPQILKSFGAKYARLINLGGSVEIEKTNENEKLLNILANTDLISSFSEKKDMFKVNQKRKR